MPSRSKGNKTIVTRAMKTLNDGKDACASTMATTSSSLGQQLQWHQWQRQLHIEDNDAIMTRTTMPAQ
jgi:hypothetical protein